MNKVNKGLITLVVILGLLVICLGGYIVYDKVLKGDIDNETYMNEENKEVLLTNEEVELILKGLDEKYYQFHTRLGAYCGEFNSDDYISFGSYETNDFRDYWASKEFNSINELKEYLESIMISDLVPEYMNDGVTYIEQDGKLYCQLAHIGGGITRNYEIDAEYTIKSVTYDKIGADIVFCGTDMGEVECSDRNASITIVKDLNGEWLVSEYELVY